MSSTWRTTVIHPGVHAPKGFRSLSPPTYRGSTTLFESAADVKDSWRHDIAPYSYGLYGTPTTLELAARVAELEGGTHTFVTPGGQAAIALIYLACVESGSHVLVPESVYGPSRALADRLLRRLGIEVTYYDPLIGAAIDALLRDTTRLVWCESPGSVTMEVQDVPAIAEAAHRRGAVVALDNTYAAGVLFDALGHGVDVTMQALTKYVGGHSDLLLGSVTVRDERLYEGIGDAHQLLGMAVSPDDCTLALRGLQTLAVRLSHVEASAIIIARWLCSRLEIEVVLHPAFPSCPGHERLEARLHGIGQRLLDRIPRRLLRGAGDSIRRQPAALQDRVQLGRRHEPRRAVLRREARSPLVRDPSRPIECGPREDNRARRRPRSGAEPRGEWQILIPQFTFG
jgi:cysteine-S-conjugate beta-lyase